MIQQIFSTPVSDLFASETAASAVVKTRRAQTLSPQIQRHPPFTTVSPGILRKSRVPLTPNCSRFTPTDNRNYRNSFSEDYAKSMGKFLEKIFQLGFGRL